MFKRRIRHRRKIYGSENIESQIKDEENGTRDDANKSRAVMYPLTKEKIQVLRTSGKDYLRKNNRGKVPDWRK